MILLLLKIKRSLNNNILLKRSSIGLFSLKTYILKITSNSNGLMIVIILLLKKIVILILITSHLKFFLLMKIYTLIIILSNLMNLKNIGIVIFVNFNDNRLKN